MSQAGDGPNGSEDDDSAITQQKLTHFWATNSPKDHQATLKEAENDNMSVQDLTGSSDAKSSFEIVPPTIQNPEDYEFLPGHFEALRVLAVDMNEPKVIVRLKSGERTTIATKELLKLTNGPQALRDFIDGSQSPDPLTMSLDHTPRLIYADGDGSSDDNIQPDLGLARDRQRRRGVSGTSFAHFFNPRFKEASSAEPEESEELDETSSEPDDDSEDDVRSGSRRNPKRKTQKRKRVVESYEEPSDSDTNKRTSSRIRNNKRRNLRERQEDDEMSEVEYVAPKPKFFGAKEQFVELDDDDIFRESHSERCFSCERWDDEETAPELGSLVSCQGCTSSFHQQCLGIRSTRKHLVTKVGEGNFILQCANCLGIKHRDHDIVPHLGHCATCKEAGPMSEPLRNSFTPQEEQQLREQNGGIDPVTEVDMSRVNNVSNLLLRCNGCKRGFHFDHILPEDEQDRSNISKEEWQCDECCAAPTETQPIDVIVAWRPKAELKVVPKLVEMIPEIDKEYLIKWPKQSYFHVSWVSGDWVWCMAHSGTFKSFHNSARSTKPILTTEEAVPEENLLVDIIFDVEYIRKPKSSEERADPTLVKRAYVKFQGLPYEDTVWEDPPKQTNKGQWDDFKAALADKVNGESIQPPIQKDLQTRLQKARTQTFQETLVLESQPALVTGGQLMDYQLEGVNWLYYMYLIKKNAILADDMGLGKTLQIISLISALIENFECFPFLIVVPNSTVPNWRREIRNWAPKVRVVTYFGSMWARGMAEEYEMFSHGKLSCHIVIASYESMCDSRTKRVLGGISWAGLVVDEGQRLKNDETVLYDRLRRMKFGFKVLLTGTPLQNNIRELFNLIQFIDPTQRAGDLEERYGGQLTADDIRELHELIKPCFLRRTKAEVLPFLPPMVQIIIPISMSIVQKKLYRSILEKSPTLIQAIVKKHAGPIKKKDRHNLNNILIQLRKCLCHPYLYNRDIEDQGMDHKLAHQRLVEASGKLQLFNLMLPRLKERGHRVLIFSQFLQNLDIVEDFLTGLNLQYCRLDGQMSSRDKQKQIDMFNAPNSPIFAFLLSTRSGGVGINLATADTVIIMDPDFNPKQDMQALSRAHRIGQKNAVLVFHLVVRASVEEKIMQKGKTKMALDHVLIDRMEADEDEEDLESILKHGAQALFEDDDSSDLKYDIAAIDRLLDRSQAEKVEEIAHEGDANTANQNQFNFARVWQMDRGTLEEVIEIEDSPMDTTAWESILLEREREAQAEINRQAEGLGRGKRKRAAITYNARVEGLDDEEADETSPTKPLTGKMQKFRADADYKLPDGDGDGDGDESESADDANMQELSPDDQLTVNTGAGQQALRQFRRVASPQPAPRPGTDGASDLPQCLACEGCHPPGSCPLRSAGVELCGLCGIAHFSHRRPCPHLNSAVQIRLMVQALDQSTEDPVLVRAARKYLKGVLGNIQTTARRKAEREAAQKKAEEEAASGKPDPQVDPPSVDMADEPNAMRPS